MFALRRLTTAAARTVSRPNVLNIARPKVAAELRLYEATVALRWSSSESSSGGYEASRQSPNILRGGAPRLQDRDQDPMAMQVPHRDIPPTKVIYVGNLKYETTEQEIRDKFQDFGEVQAVRIPRTAETGIPRGFAYVEYSSLAEAAEAIEAMHQAPFNGRRLNCQYVNNQNSLRVRVNPESKTLFIGNLSFNTTDEDLNELFKDVVGCLDVRVAMDRRTHQPRGFVHADFADVASAVKAKAQLEGTQLYGRQIRIDFSVPPEQRLQNMQNMQNNFRNQDTFQQQQPVEHQAQESAPGQQPGEGRNVAGES